MRFVFSFHDKKCPLVDARQFSSLALHLWYCLCFSVVVTVGALSSPYTSGRVLLLLKTLADVSGSASSKRAKKNSGLKAGSVVEAEVL